MMEHGALRVFAAGSLRPAFDAIAAEAPGTLHLEYDNARTLAKRIQAGEPVDVFASASAAHPRALHDAGLVSAPRPFATNRLVIALPAARVAADFSVLAEPATRVVIEVAGIPLGDYTRDLLDRLDTLSDNDFAARVLANVVDEVQTVDAVAARLLTGQADAAVLYATDVAARPGRLRAIEVPDAAAVATACVACVVTATAQAGAAHAWFDALSEHPVRAILQRAGFGPPATRNHHSDDRPTTRSVTPET